MLKNVAFSQAHLSSELLNIYCDGLQNEKNNDESIDVALSTLKDIIETKQFQPVELLKLVQIVTRLKNSGPNSLGTAYSLMGMISIKQPSELTSVLNAFNGLVVKEQNNSSSLALLSRNLMQIVNKYPDKSSMLLSTIKLGMQNKNNDLMSLGGYFRILNLILDKCPNLSSDVLSLIAQLLEKNKDYIKISKAEIFKLFMNIIKTDADISMIFPIISSEMKNEKKDRDIYRLLKDIVTQHPNMTSNVLDIIKEGLKSKEVDSQIYRLLTDIVIQQPDLVSNVMEIVKSASQEGKLPPLSHVNVYALLDIITDEKSDFIPEVIKMIFNNNDNLNDNNIKYSIRFCAKCMKERKLQDFYTDLAHNEVAEKILSIASKTKFLMQDEISYVYDNYGLEKILQMNFSAQQRSMNVLMGQLYKEEKLPTEEAIHYRKDAKNNEIYQSNKDWLISASFNAAQIFGCYFPSYIKQTEKYLSTHDAVYWLPKDLPENRKESFRSFIQKNLIYDNMYGQRLVRPLAEIEMISRNWKYLKPGEEKLKYKDILAICASKKYDDIEYSEFAIEAAKWGIDASEYKDLEGIYKAGLHVPEPFDSAKKFKFGKYTGRFLPRTDVRTGFFGNYTDCCQHFKGVGDSCAVSTIKDPYSQLFVIENDEGRIIAGSWVWENTEGEHKDVCFDNIEAIGEYAKNPLVNKIYEMVGRYLIEENNCHKVTIGLGYQDADISKYKETEGIPLPLQYNDKYSDAKGKQVLLAENPKAVPLDKTKESTRFIRDVCFEDIDAMDSVSEKCFPEGDDRLQVPQCMAGFVLVDANKGIVGYCLYDKEEKSVYDMAVLPEYRTDKNASSKKLFGSLIKRIRDIGGEWTAELRDKTTYRYLEVMSQRGLVAFENNGIDHEMSDGSKVYSVTFSVPKKEKNEKNMIFSHKSAEYGD